MHFCLIRLLLAQVIASLTPSPPEISLSKLSHARIVGCYFWHVVTAHARNIGRSVPWVGCGTPHILTDRFTPDGLVPLESWVVLEPIRAILRRICKLIQTRRNSVSLRQMLLIAILVSLNNLSAKICS